VSILSAARVPRPMRLITGRGVRVVGDGDRARLSIDSDLIEMLAEAAFRDTAHFLRREHLEQLAAILDDPEASANDRFVALDLLRNANVAAGQVLPMCQDTGTAIVHARRGHLIDTDGDDEEHLVRGIGRAYETLNLRYSQLSPVTMWEEVNTGTNLPAQIEIEFAKGQEYEFLFIAKGGGSANKSFLYQETKELLRPERFIEFIREKLELIGTSACPPYHLAIVVGGTSAEYAMKTAKLASTHALDGLPNAGGSRGEGYRDLEMERAVRDVTIELGIGAQFGGKYFCHDVRVIRLPRHTGSLPVAIAVSCSADRQAVGLITAEGAFLEELERDPAAFLPAPPEHLDVSNDGGAKGIDLNRPMAEILDQLQGVPVGARVSLNGPLVVARDLAHATIRAARERGEQMPQYMLDHPVYYAGPAKTPPGMPSGSFGPTTAGRMDGYIEEFQAEGASLVTLAKGNRSPAVAASCGRHGGVYLGSVGGPAALIAEECIRSVEVIDLPELGMEAVFRIDVVDFPAFVVIDSGGNDFYARSGKTPLRLGKTRRTT
jgi:fumarate hydratase class I